MRSIGKRNGVSGQAVHKAIKRGRLDPTADSPVADAMFKANADLNKMLRGMGIEYVPKDYAEAQTALEQLKVQEKAFKLQQLASTLVDREEANREYYELGKRLRESWEQWPARVASEMATRLKVTPHAMQEVLTEFVKANLATMNEVEVLRLKSDKRERAAAA